MIYTCERKMEDGMDYFINQNITFISPSINILNDYVVAKIIEEATLYNGNVLY